MAPALQLCNLSVSYDRGPWIVREVNLDIAVGECIGILGANGSGKSSIAMALLGIIPQLTPGRVAGSIDVAGVTLGPHVPIGARLLRIGYAFQDAESQVLFGTVRDSLGLDDPVATSSLLCEAVRIMRISHLLDRSAEQLSGGERMRVMLVSALCSNPPLLIYDEATSALDVATKRRFYELLTYLSTVGVTVVLVGQRREVLEPYCNRSYHLANGRLEPLTDLASDCVAPEWPVNFGNQQHTKYRPLRFTRMRSRRGLFALGPLELLISPGETVALMGPNGGGKSTLLSTLGGGLRILDGHIEFDGVRYDRRTWRRLAGIITSVTQSPIASVIGTTIEEELDGRINEAQLDLLRNHFAPTLDFLTPARDPLDLSFGQLRLLTFIAAISGDAPIITIDEPELGLDSRALSLVLAWLRDARRRTKRTVVMSTHDFFVAAHADRVLVFDGGQIIAERASMDPCSAGELQAWYECQPAV